MMSLLILVEPMGVTIDSGMLAARGSETVSCSIEFTAASLGAASALVELSSALASSTSIFTNGSYIKSSLDKVYIFYIENKESKYS